MTACYLVEHETRYRYAAAVTTSQHVAYLRPRALHRQHVLWSRLDLEPVPSRASRRLDYFGNEVDSFAVLEPHVELTVVGRSQVVVREADPAPSLDAAPAWEVVRDGLRYRAGARPGEAAGYLYASPHVPIAGELAELGRPSFPPGCPFLAGAADLTRRIHSEFRYDPKATDVATPVSRVLAERRGVCQDFAHLQIACLRSLGLPARYVSGYLVTGRTPGGERLTGADASHAWVAVPRGGGDWLDLDPTNGILPGDTHVTLAWGRDYSDVSPLRGVILGGAEHELDVAVHVTPVAAPEDIGAPPAPPEA